MKRTAKEERRDGNNDLNLYIHHGSSHFRFDIEGSLSGKGAKEVELSWRTASSVIGNRAIVIAVDRVSGIDAVGRGLLHEWRDAGAQFVAKSPLAKTLVGSIVGQPVVSGMEAGKRDGWVGFRACALPLISLMAMFAPATLNAATLEPATSKAWEEYVESAAIRMEQRLTPGMAFLWVDEAPERLARVRAGEIVVLPIGPQNPKRVPAGLIHDWVGAVFIPHATLKDLLQVMRDYARYKEVYEPTVIDSKVIAAGEAKDRFSMRLAYRSLLLKTALDTDYESCYVHVDDRRVYSVSRTTRIQEIEEYGGPAQRTLHEGQGIGIIWRLFSIARYVERDGGVYFEVEVIGLSRDIPASLRWLAEPIVRRVSRGSLTTSLRQTESAARLLLRSCGTGMIGTQ
jgi:hypothetical protein